MRAGVVGATTRRSVGPAAFQYARRTMVTAKLGEAKDATAACAWKKSCYSGIDYTIGDDSTVFEGEFDRGCYVDVR